MRLQRVKDVFKNFVKGNYLFGYTFTNRFSYSRWNGIFDALAGGALGIYTAGAMVTTGFLAASAAIALPVALIAGAPVAALSAAGALCLNALFLTLQTCMIGLSVGLLTAAADKSGLPRPMGLIRSARATVSSGIAGGVNLVKKPFKPLTALFKKVSGKKAAFANRAKKTAPGNNPVF